MVVEAADEVVVVVEVTGRVVEAVMGSVIVPEHSSPQQSSKVYGSACEATVT